jgi:hypothetical protein
MNGQGNQYPPQGVPQQAPAEQEPYEEEEIPLLEDLDIDLNMVKENLKSVIFFKEFKEENTEDPDMTGPLIVGFTLAMTLMLVIWLLKARARN